MASNDFNTIEICRNDLLNTWLNTEYSTDKTLDWVHTQLKERFLTEHAKDEIGRNVRNFCNRIRTLLMKANRDPARLRQKHSKWLAGRIIIPNFSTDDGPQLPLDPPDNLRFDTFDHWPAFGGAEGPCQYCKTKTTMCKCVKCNVHLCLNIHNCFLKYHTTPLAIRLAEAEYE